MTAAKQIITLEEYRPVVAPSGNQFSEVRFCLKLCSEVPWPPLRGNPFMWEWVTYCLANDDHTLP